jgi:predicted nucleic acid-binding protein
MTTVVSDTSPINYLCLIGALEILPRLFERVLIPPAVFAELGHAGAPAEVLRWKASLPAWVQIQKPTQLAPLGLDDGETEAIALALELHVSAILIDERKGRAVARQQGLLPIGTLSILVAAAERGLLDLATAIAQLKLTNFHVDESLLDALLLEARQRRDAQS